MSNTNRKTKAPRLYIWHKYPEGNWVKSDCFYSDRALAEEVAEGIGSACRREDGEIELVVLPEGEIPSA